MRYIFATYLLHSTNEHIEKIQISKNNVEENKVKILPKTSSVR